MKLLVTGSRDWSDTAMLRAALDEVLAEAVGVGVGAMLVVVHGDCPDGADAQAEAWVRRQRSMGRPVDSERHPANWARHGKSAGMIRNSEMVAGGADRCLAFFEPGAANKGTGHCAAQAAAAGIPVVEFPPLLQDALF